MPVSEHGHTRLVVLAASTASALIIVISLIAAGLILNDIHSLQNEILADIEEFKASFDGEKKLIRANHNGTGTPRRMWRTRPGSEWLRSIGDIPFLPPPIATMTIHRHPHHRLPPPFIIVFDATMPFQPLPTARRQNAVGDERGQSILTN